MRILHLVVTANFAGTERYVSEVARACTNLGDEVTVVGGDPGRMSRELGHGVRWLPGSTPREAAWSVLRGGRFDLCHVHLTHAEAVGVALRHRHRARLVSTRHIAARRGSTRAGRFLAPWLASRLDVEIAGSRFVAERVERPPTAILPFGVEPSPPLWHRGSRVVLLLQRLEPEKDPLTAVRGWARSGMAELGWSLRVVGDGSQRTMLEAEVQREAIPAVTFAGWSAQVRAELTGAGLLVAPSPVEAFGLSVVEAMAAGVPVLAAAGGGHLETVGDCPGGMSFSPGDPSSLGHQLSAFAELADDERAELSVAARTTQQARFTLHLHVTGLRRLYTALVGAGEPAEARPHGSPAVDDRQLPQVEPSNPSR